MTSVEIAETLAAFADVLLPGDSDFPSATTSGALGLFAGRIRSQRGAATIETLAATLDGLCDGFRTATPETRIGAVTTYAAREPALFAFFRQTLYLSYYEMPGVIASLQALGHDYNAAPQPEGYAMTPFDPERHLPTHARGFFKATDDVRPIDVSSLADLNLPQVYR